MSQPNNRRFSNTRIVQEIAYSLERAYQVEVTQRVNVEETPESIRHSCPMTGITILKRDIYVMMLGNTYLEIPYYFCQVCGKLYTYKNYE